MQFAASFLRPRQRFEHGQPRAVLVLSHRDALAGFQRVPQWLLYPSE